MSDYTKTTDFAAKDGLTTGDPLKTITGTLHDDEFNNIQTAVNSKADETRDLTAGAGMTGGGTLASDRTFNVIAGTGITVNADDVQLNLTYTDARFVTTGAASIKDTGDLTFNDNVKVSLGTGDDSQLYFDGTDTLLSLSGSFNVDSDAFVITSDKDVGIGTTSISGAVGYTTMQLQDSTGAQIRLGSDTARAGRILATGSAMNIYNEQTGPINLYIDAGIEFTVKGTGVINIPNMPTSAAGLSSGDLWNNSGVVTIV